MYVSALPCEDTKQCTQWWVCHLTYTQGHRVRTLIRKSCFYTYTALQHAGKGHRSLPAVVFLGNTQNIEVRTVGMTTCVMMFLIKHCLKKNRLRIGVVEP